ncbi:MAG: hypothetical protein HYX48_03795 [Chlamydiales bacterium]|nr:hypothetical protein [Chlamydiales bacterium]
MSEACTIAPLCCLPQQIDFLPLAQALAPDSLIKLHSRDADVRALTEGELNFIEREILPRLFAQLITCLALLNAAGNLILSGAFFLSYPIHLVLSDNSVCTAVFDKAMQNLEISVLDAASGVRFVYAWALPTEILNEAFSDTEIEQKLDPVTEDPPAAAIVEEAPEAELPTFHDGDEGPTFHVASPPSEPQDVDPVPRIASPPSELQDGPTFHIVSPPSEAQSPTSAAAAAAAQAAIELSMPMIELSLEQSLAAPAAAAAKPASAAPAEEKKAEEKKSEDPFDAYGLIASEKELADVKEMITDLGTKNKKALLLQKKRMLELGVSTDKMHTLRFIHTILKNPDLKRNLLLATGDTFKWLGFYNGVGSGTDGIKGALLKLDKEGKIERYLPGFYASLKVNAEEASAYLTGDKMDTEFFSRNKVKNWEGWLKFLLSTK